MREKGVAVAVVAAAVIVIVIVVGVGAYFAARGEEAGGENQQPQENQQLHPENCLIPGDIIITLNEENLMYLGKISLGHRNHAGIYVGNGEVVEATPLRVMKSPLSSWTRRRVQIGVEILRVNVSDDVRENAVKFAEAQLGENYDFDWTSKQYENSENEWYCSELVWAAYFNQGIDLDPNTQDDNVGMVTPQEIYDSEYTKVISTELLPECSEE